jgi:VanZ family protein
VTFSSQLIDSKWLRATIPLETRNGSKELTMFWFFKYWAPPILWACLISTFSSGDFSSEQTSHFLLPLFQWLLPQASPESLMSLHLLTRKLGHWGEYFVLAMLLYRAFRAEETRGWQARWAFRTLALVFLYALADESHQALIPSRQASVQDSLLDLCGGICAMGLLYFRHRIQSSAVVQRVRVTERSRGQSDPSSCSPEVEKPSLPSKDRKSPAGTRRAL